MKIDEVGQTIYNDSELVSMLYTNPNLDLSLFTVAHEDALLFNDSVSETYSEFPKVKEYKPFFGSIEEFHFNNQQTWFMPEEYHNMDIAQWVMDQCKTDAELQRVGEELLLYQDRNLFLLLKQLKYIVDTWRKNGVVWGVGRGSSVASYVLYLIGIHKINSMYYDLDIHEFLR
ncbi:Bacterial DNA polymerase III, alpha subunit [uncultured Caudovirales phage]|uniref:Bacterial DNA polymerase III, alpha subunit n=1 Tax=uncultured Caudovirales phage TaxID=2100421 RepID=A0A6J5LKS9_9CAUD|nr:Bacterial DNA polymerase III, alpha subunit [uncultured Caudovirales phage]